MPANVQTMAYYGEKPWHRLGNPVPKGVTAEEMIRAAGLDWLVDLRPARGAKEVNKKGEFSRFEVLRMPRPATKETEVLLGIVSRRYHALQNVEASEFFDPLVGENKAFFETAGALGEGERIWVMAKMPGAMQIVPRDECLEYLLLSNTHSGDGSVPDDSNRSELHSKTR
jgi:phage/plasmid-like protein (TIGR03299 family)